MIDPIDLIDPRWETSYPNIPPLRSGQSLPGYALELDAANDLDPGFTFRLIRRTGTGPAHLAAPGKWLSTRCFDLDRLATLAACPRERLEALTALPIIQLLYGDLGPRSLSGRHVLGQRPTLALCPLCILQGEIPLATLFAFIDGCARHGIRLKSNCRAQTRAIDGELVACFTPITLFSGGDRFFSCQRLECGASYTALPVELLEPMKLAAVRARDRVLSDLLAKAADPLPLRAGFGRCLRGALLPKDLPRGQGTALATALRQDRPSLPTLVEALVVTGTTVEEWRDLMRDGAVRSSSSSTVARRPRRFFPSSSTPICPQCNASQPYRNGRAATVDRMQEFICKRCGTRYTQHQVLFSFDPHPTYRRVLAERNGKRLERYRAAVAATLSTWPGDLAATRTAVFARAGVPRSIPYTTERAGLVQLVATHLSHRRVTAKTRSHGPPPSSREQHGRAR